MKKTLSLPTSAPRSLGIFVVLAAAIIAAISWLIQSPQFAARPDLLAMASSIDMALLIPGIYFLLIRKTKIPKVTVVPIFVISLTIAGLIIPEQYQQTLNIIEYAIPFVELFVIGFVVYNVRKTVKAYKREKHSLGSRGFLETIQEATEKAFGKSALANALATEISIFHYALFGWKSKVELNEAKGFTYHKENAYGAFVGVVFFALVAETFVFHLLLSQWTLVGAWILTGLSIYSVFFVAGDFNAVRKRPMYLTENGLQVRIGLRWRIFIPFEEIASIELRTPDKEQETFAHFVVNGEANTVIQLHSEMTAKGLYGLKKRFTTLALHIDEKDAFKAVLEEKIA